MPPLTYYFGLTFGSKNKECEEKKKCTLQSHFPPKKKILNFLYTQK